GERHIDVERTGSSLGHTRACAYQVSNRGARAGARAVPDETRNLESVSGAGGLGQICFLNYHHQRLVSRHVHREGVGGVEGGAAAGIAEIIRTDGTCIPRGRRNVSVEVGHGKNGATRGRVRRGERDRSASRSRSVREAQDIVVPISTPKDARAGFGRSATAHQASPAHAAFLDGI